MEAEARAQEQIAAAQDEAAVKWQYSQLVIGEVEHLVEQRLPAVVQEIRGVPVQSQPGLRHDSFDGSEIAGYLTAIEDVLRGTAADVRRQVEESARAGVRVAAEEMQASLTRAQRDIDTALDDDDEHRGDIGPRTLAKIDHSVTLASHTVQRLRIIADSWPGVQRANCSIVEIIESARGHIRQVDAVEYAFQPETADVLVEGLIVEPVIVALTELLDNATSYSGERVSAYVQRVAAGMRITVEDSGLGMSPLQLERAERALASGGADVTALAEPFSLGFLVIGRLIHDYGLRVSLSPSAAGGVRANLMIPAERLVAVPAEVEPTLPTWSAPLPPAAPQPVPAQLGSAAGTGMVPAADPSWTGPRHEPPTPAPAPAHGAAAVSVALPLPLPAEAAGSAARVHGLPKRQPRRVVRQGTAPRQQAISDPEAYTEGFGQLSRILADGFDADHTTEG
ncbi:hypothetical protein ACFQ0G_53610 [Streptomyces chiangmaiensis]